MKWGLNEQGKLSKVELNPGIEIKIMDPSGSREVSKDEEGELWVRGPNVCRGYWRNETATRQALLDNGWFVTGDIATLSEDEVLRIVARKNVSGTSSITRLSLRPNIG